MDSNRRRRSGGQWPSASSWGRADRVRGAPPPPRTTGLYDLAILYPDRDQLADAVYRVLNAGIQLNGASDHGVSEAVYLADPDQNGIELYCDRPPELWPRDSNGGLAMSTMPLDLGKLLGERVATLDKR